MTSLIPLFIFAAILHITVFVAGLFLVNLGDVANYGGETGFLPSTGDSANAYDQFSSWLAGGGPTSVEGPEDSAGVSTFRWIVKTPMCGMVSLVKTIITLSIVNYDLVNLLPTEGFGNWLRIIIHSIGALITLALFARLTEIAIRAGVFSNIYMLAVIGLVSVGGIVATLLNAGGAFSCG